MTDTTSSSPVTPAPTGVKAVLGVVTALGGVFAALYPQSPVVCAMTALIPALKTALPVTLTAIGAVVAAYSHPPGKRKAPSSGSAVS